MDSIYIHLCLVYLYLHYVVLHFIYIKLLFIVERLGVWRKSCENCKLLALKKNENLLMADEDKKVKKKKKIEILWQSLFPNERYFNSKFTRKFTILNHQIG